MCIQTRTALALMLAAILASPVLAQVKKTIYVETGDNKAVGVRFDGSGSFDPKANFFETEVQLLSGAEIRDVIIKFDEFEVPVRLVISPRRPGDIRFSVSRPNFRTCETSDIHRVTRASTSGSIDERLSLLVQSRRLMQLCRQFNAEYTKLVRRYYEANCALAGVRPAMFAIHQEAKEEFEKLPNNQLKRKTREDCKGRGTGADIEIAYNQALKYGPDAQALAAELLTKANDPNWQDGFTAARINAQTIKELEVVRIKREQDKASAQNELTTALNYNSELVTLAGDDEYKSIFTSKSQGGIGVTLELLARDRAWFESRSEAMQQAAMPQR